MTTISATLTGDTAVRLAGAGHTWRADEPREVGGTDTGPSPYELLLGALAACTCMTVSLYAARRGIAVESVSAHYSHDRTHRRDCEDCAEDEQSAFIDRITGEIVITADADEDQRRRLAEVALRCPVRRTLEAHIHFSDDVRFEA